MYGPERVQTIEEYESASPRSSPARPGKLKSATVQLASRVNIPRPGWLRGSTLAEINDAALLVGDPFGSMLAINVANSPDSSKPRRTYSRPYVGSKFSQNDQPPESGSRIK